MAIQSGVEEETSPHDIADPRIEDDHAEWSYSNIGDDEWDIGEVFELLKNDRRRAIINFLKQQDDRTWTADELAEHIAALENDVTVSQLSSAQRKRVYIALYQFHLPKMDRQGVIDFDKARGTVELRDTAALDPFLTDADPESTIQMERVIAVTVAVIVGIGLTGIGFLAAVPNIVWPALGVGALLWVTFAKL